MLANTQTAPSAQANPAAAPGAARLIELIVIHCSATASGRPQRMGLPGLPSYINCAQIIDAWHAKRGFRRSALSRQRCNPTLGAIGYHFVIDLDGAVFTGRHLDEVGAHALGHNLASVGICLIGGREPDARYTPAQWASLGELVRRLSAQCQVPFVFNTQRGVCGHRDLSPDRNGNGVAEPQEWLKTCPGFDVRGWLYRGLQPLPLNVFTPEV